MKKFLALIFAFTMCISAFSCEEKKQNDDTPDEVSEDVAETPEIPDTGDTVVENSFREYAESDFTEITVPLNYTDDPAPVVLHQLDIPDYDFGERLAPCKTSDDPSEFDPFDPKRFHGYSWIDENGVEHKPESTYMKVLDVPEKGIITGAVYSDDKVYITVSYDNFCSGCHEWSIFAYDINTTEMKEVYRYSGYQNDNGFGGWLDPFVEDGNIVFSSFTPFEAECRVYSIDLETGEEKQLYESSDYVYISDGVDKVLFCDAASAEGKRDKVELTLKEYDFTTGELKTITENEETKMYNVAASDLTAYIRKPLDSRKCELVTEHYSVKTGVTNASIVYASDKKAVIVTEGDVRVLHTYDFEKMEHYITEIGKTIGQFISYGENVIFSHNSEHSDVYYIVPELGRAMTVAKDIDHDIMKRSGDTVTFNHMKNDTLYLDVDESTQRGYYRPVEVFWLGGGEK
ncbi:MAG: hypothetical protein J6M07_07660 [Ruminococcus sp.]|nr:hypothetical protein [Ruminococcus sp.]